MADQIITRLPTVRALDDLPQLEHGFYTPHKQTAFDQAVLDHCQTGHTRAKSTALSDRNSFFERRKSTQIFDLLSAPVSHQQRACKVILSGDVAVGKTSLVNRFGRAIHSSAYQTTIGVDFDLQRFKILGQPYTLQIWDTAGLERFKCINSAYYRGCHVALLVFDMSNMGTMASVLRWRDEVLSTELRDGQPRPLLFLVGTKYDLPLTESSKSFIEEQANKIAQLLEAELWFVSSVTGYNVDKLFERVAALAFNRTVLDEISCIKTNERDETKTFDRSTMRRSLIKHTSSCAGKLIKITRETADNQRGGCCIGFGCNRA